MFKIRDIITSVLSHGGSVFNEVRNADNVIWGDGKRSRVKEVDFQKSLSDNVKSEDEPEKKEKQKKSIYFYDNVDMYSVQRLIMDLRYISEKLIDETEEIWLYINSSGGDLMAGFSAMDEIKNISQKIPIYTLIDNSAASAATLMSIVGNIRYIKKNGFILIHELSSFSMGKYTQLADSKKNMDMFMEKIKNAYREYANVPEDELDEILRHDIWWDAETALKYGLVDEIVS